jgi:hypothetical protein
VLTGLLKHDNSNDSNNNNNMPTIARRSIRAKRPSLKARSSADLKAKVADVITPAVVKSVGRRVRLMLQKDNKGSGNESDWEDDNGNDNNNNGAVKLTDRNKSDRAGVTGVKGPPHKMNSSAVSAPTGQDTEQGPGDNQHGLCYGKQEEHNLDTILQSLHIDEGKKVGYEYEGSLQGRNESRQATPFVSAYLDPRVYLRAPKQSDPHLDICDFVNLSAPVRIEVTESSDALSLFDQIMKAKTGPRKPKLEDVTIAEWGMANQRIMAELFNPPGPETEYYMAYTLKIFEMFTKFDRVRVLEYDRAYRIKQAASKFLWGTDLPHCSAMTVAAPPRHPIRQFGPTAQHSGHVSQQGGRRRQGTYGSAGKPICSMYNQQSGCRFGQKCNYSHICDQCRESHPSFVHSSQPAYPPHPANTLQSAHTPQRNMAGQAPPSGAAHAFVPRH